MGGNGGWGGGGSKSTGETVDAQAPMGGREKEENLENL